MATIEAQFFSPSLSQQARMTVLLPDTAKGPFPVFYLLHGYFDDHTSWLHHSRIVDYVRRWPMIVAMPAGFNGFYTDHYAGLPFGRYILEDVIGFVERNFPVRRKRPSCCLGGLSMGGYGALRLGFTRPDLFASITCHSGAPRAWPDAAEHEKDAERQRIFGPRPNGGPNDVTALATDAAKRKIALPKIHLDCGRSDHALAINRRFHQHLKKLGIAHQYKEFAGAHKWEYWDARLCDALAFHAAALKISIH
jgi:S-formylglutathione hydrolase FrmB